MKIAVTGSNGIVGSRLCPALERHHDIVRIDLRDADINADVQDRDAMRAALAGCDAVVHLAGISAVHASWEDVYGPNIGGTYAVFDAARDNGLRHIIFASSNHGVGMHEVRNAPALYEPGFGLVLHGEGEPYRPDGLYGVWKAFGETLGRYYSDAFGINVACIRIGSMTEADDPKDASVEESSGWLNLTVEQKYKRYAATWMSHADFHRLVEAILARNVPYAIVYGVSDNATRFWDLEPGRALYGFWPQDGTR